MADFEGAQRQRVRDAQRERDAARQRRAPAAAHVGDEPDAERGDGQQAGQRDRSVDGEFAAAPEVGEQRERRAQDERAAVGRGELQELREMAVNEREERGAGLDFVVVPDEPVQPEPDHRGGPAGRREHAQGVLTRRTERSMAHGSASARWVGGLSPHVGLSALMPDDEEGQAS